MLNSPGARFNEPIGCGVEAIDQQQQHRPDEKVAEHEQDRRHGEVAFR
jgi:hypothetical protein